MRETRSRRFPIHLNLQIDTGNSRGEIVDRRVFDFAKAGFLLGPEVGNRTLDNPHDILAVVDALNGAQWFEANHGGWADEVSLVLHFRPGEQRTYHVALYLRREGAVLISMSNYGGNGRGSGWSNGAAFCPRLPAALTASGIYLPQERAEQHKDQRAESEEAASKQRSARVVPIVIFGFLTLGALQFFYRLINGQDLGSKTVGSSTDQLQLTTTMVGLSMSAIIAAGCGLRVMHAFLDWPDPTNRGTLLSVWLVVLSGGVIVLLARRKTGTGTTT